jgi:LacI family transcriptional regulator
MASTINDVARLAGVSITTVSHVINGTRFVSEDLRKRVADAMQTLNYQPNSLARSLRMGLSKSIGLIVPDISNLFFAEIARAIEDAGYQHGYSVILCNTDDDPQKEATYVDVLRAKQVDGVIFISAGGISEGVNKLLEAHIPMVVIDREIPNIAADIVLVDNLQGGYLAARHLIETGHRRIACIAGPSDLTPSNQRLVGYQRALVEASLDCDERLVVRGDFHAETGYKAALDLLQIDPRPTAIFACNDMMAIGALHAAYALKIRVPEDLAIVGFDDIELVSYVYPPLTSMAQPKQEIGKMAVDLIMERIHFPASLSRTIVLQSQLILRQSSSTRL